MARSRRTLHAALEESATPPDTLTSTQSVARVVQAEGNNLYTCQLPASAKGIIPATDSTPSEKTAAAAAAAAAAPVVLVELDARFRNTVFMRRGGYVLVDLASAEERRQAGRKVVGEIVNVVRDEKAWRKEPYWPVEFAKIPVYSMPDSDDEDNNVGRMPPSDSEEE